MGRPSIPGITRINLTLRKEEIAELESLREEFGFVSKADVIRHLIRERKQLKTFEQMMEEFSQTLRDARQKPSDPSV